MSIEQRSMEAWAVHGKDIDSKDSKGNIEASVIPKARMMPGSGKVDTQRLEHFSDVDSLHSLLKHPVLMSFLELEMNSLRKWYFLDFITYLLFVVLLFTYLGNK